MPLAIAPGTLIANRYRVQRQLGKGGMGEVWAAENTRTGRLVAIKVLRAESKQKKTAIERFRREARAAGAIQSDYVTQVLDVEDDAAQGIVLVFELLEGESLVERLKRTGPIPYPELWGIVEAVWIGLADAHAAGVIHRDLKPSNVFLEQRKQSVRVKILDFGTSKLPKKLGTQSLTQMGQSLGTFSFMPPEQIGKAKTVDHRADIYSCTTLVYQAMSGRLPYQAKNVVAMMELKNNQEPRTLGAVMSEPVDPQLEAFITRGLARSPDDRFQTAQEALDAWRALRPEGALSQAEFEASGAYPISSAQPPNVEAQAGARAASAAPAIPQAAPRSAAVSPPVATHPPALHLPPSSPPPLHRDKETAPGIHPPPHASAPPHTGTGIPEADSDASTLPNRHHREQLLPQGSTSPSASVATVPDAAPAAPSVPPASHLPHSSQRKPASALRLWLAIIAAGIGLMLVGFVAVAIILRVLGH